MKTNEILFAVSAGLVVVLAWMAARLSELVPFEWIIGFGSLGATFGLAAFDYRVRAKKLFR